MNSKVPSDDKPFVLFILGGPGAGKGELCKYVASNYNFVHVSTGELLRKEAESNSEKSKEINKTMQEGHMVDTEIMTTMIVDKMREHGWQGAKFLLDGYPRDQENFDFWNDKIAQKVNGNSALFLECKPENMLERIKKRSKDSGREDDSDEAKIKNRIDVFHEVTMPIVKQIQDTYGLFEVNGNMTIEEVREAIKPYFDSLDKPQQDSS